MIGYQRLSRALLSGPWTARAISLRLAPELGWLTPGPQLSQLADSLVARWPDRPAPAELVALLRRLPDVADEARLSPPPRPPVGSTGRKQILRQQPDGVSAVDTRADLTSLLWLTEAELEWFADTQLRNTAHPTGPLQHYRYRHLAVPGKIRLLEIPKPRLMEIQRRLLTHLVRALPLHPAAHGAVARRSVRTCLQPHAGRDVLVRCDLEGFFASITRARVRGLFTTTGLQTDVAALLAGLLTAAVPVAVRRALPPTGDLDARRRTLARLAAPHLPQGAPTSPGVANAVCYSLDHRLNRLAYALGAQYSRYVDDLVFSGPATLPVGTLLAGVRAVVRDENFQLAERKTAVLRSSQRQAVLGAVVNDTVSIDRRELDRLRAVLHNCARHGVAGQLRGQDVSAFRAELLGQLAWVTSINEEKGNRLRTAFDAVAWPT